MIRVVVALLALTGSVLAQPAQQAGDEVVPVTFNADACKPVKKKLPGNGKKPGDQPDGTPVVLPTKWTDFEITGSFVDRKGLERDLLGPILSRHTAITEDTREEIAATAAQFGYHVVGLGTRETNGKTNAVLHIAPMPIVRRVEVDIEQSLLSTPFEDEVKRRMRVRTGTYLPWPPDQRKCILAEEKRRIQEFLHDEGYFEAIAQVTEVIEGVGTTLEVEVALGPKYVTDISRIFVPEPERIAAVATVGEIREKFREYGTCFAGRKRLCVGSGRFTRANYEAGKQEVIEMFRQKGYPAVSVRVTDPDPDRRTKTVGFQVTIDPRRKVDVQFEGAITVPLEQLRAQLTFNKAASFDDVEKDESARAITSFLQSRGFFDARVTWYIPETAATRSDQYQPLVFQVHQGAQRTVRTVQFAGNSAISTDELEGSVSTKSARLSTSLLGTKAFTTSTTLSIDVERIVTLYRRRGYRDVRVRVSASTDPNAIGSAAYTAALLSADHGADLHVRFTIEEGLPTLLSEIHVELGDEGDKITTPEQRALCTEVLKELAQLHATPQLATLATPDQCIAIAPALEFREEDARATKDLLRDRLFSRGRPRATVDYEPVVLGPRRIAAVYTLHNTQHLRVGKIVIRGNFRTQDWVILDRLKLKEGAPLTSDALAESTRELRNTALFDSVNIRLPDLDYATAGAVNAVVEVTERHDTRLQINAELGYSTFNGAFTKVTPQLKNLFGVGISFDIGITAGFDVSDAVDGELTLRQFSLESTLRFPRWLTPDFLPFEVETELSGFHRRQDTPRFGLLKTTGGTLAFSRTYTRARTATQAAQAVTIGVQYDFRSRERNVDALRPAGADDDESQVPITTRTSIFGASVEWERRVDRSNNLQPLAPEGGFRLEGRVSGAEGLVLGEDYFIKLAVAGSKYWSPTSSLTLRADVRYDHGIPLAGAALLPEVERFFAGGDSTVRGYDDDRLATEIIQVGVPPLANVDQIRILPAGGNIRLLGSVDAQLRIWKLLTTAIFADAGVITNQWSTVTEDDVRPSVGMALVRIVTPFGAFAFERALPLRPRLGDDPRGRWHISFAARAQF